VGACPRDACASSILSCAGWDQAGAADMHNDTATKDNKLLCTRRFLLFTPRPGKNHGNRENIQFLTLKSRLYAKVYLPIIECELIDKSNGGAISNHLHY
jgi:hypothetical protein